MTQKSAVLAPIPRARVATATAVKPGDFNSVRAPNRMSRHQSSMWTSSGLDGRRLCAGSLQVLDTRQPTEGWERLSEEPPGPDQVGPAVRLHPSREREPDLDGAQRLAGPRRLDAGE